MSELWAGLSREANGYVAWVCIVVGFVAGFVRAVLGRGR
jgi:hypothetical protein